MKDAINNPSESASPPPGRATIAVIGAGIVGNCLVRHLAIWGGTTWC